MNSTVEMNAFNRSVRPVVDPVLREHFRFVLAYRPTAELEARIEELAGKSTEGRLTGEEREEYAGYCRANKFVAMLRRLARDFSPPA